MIYILTRAELMDMDAGENANAEVQDVLAEAKRIAIESDSRFVLFDPKENGFVHATSDTLVLVDPEVNGVVVGSRSGLSAFLSTDSYRVLVESVETDTGMSGEN